MLRTPERLCSVPFRLAFVVRILSTKRFPSLLSALKLRFLQSTVGELQRENAKEVSERQDDSAEELEERLKISFERFFVRFGHR